MSRSPLLPAALAAVAARLSYAGLRRVPPGGAATWSRTNHRGDTLTLLEGPAVAAGAVAAALAASGTPGRERAAMLLAGVGAGALGCYDDLAGSGSSRGFRGHLAALRRGEVTTGAVKLAGIGATGVAASVILGPAGSSRSGRSQPGGAVAGAADIVINAGLIAGGANLLNLFDLRPGRAIKVALGAGALLGASRRGRTAAAAPLGAAAALLPEDLGERAMLGDGGANALGAMLGTAATTLPRPARVATLAAVVGLTAASEVVSFTKVIQRTPALNWLDMLGRRPVAAPVPPAAPDTAAAGVAGSGAAAAAGDRADSAAAGSPAIR
jgi:UDP-N-acetylmuramyl pentapeptide phosphotransferase/UDP-N-acetylglucosamine-1-phosphate transferase